MLKTEKYGRDTAHFSFVLWITLCSNFISLLVFLGPVSDGVRRYLHLEVIFFLLLITAILF